MLKNLATRVLSIYLLFAASASSIIIPGASSTANSGSAITVPTRQDEAEVTAAPERTALELELKRQDSTNYCTEWSYANGNTSSSITAHEHNLQMFR
jgi:hypothetical protein